MEFFNGLNFRLKQLKQLEAESSKQIHEQIRFVEADSDMQYGRLSGIITRINGNKTEMEAGIQAINSAHDEVMSITMKSQKTPVTYEQVEESIKQLAMGCKDLHDRINEDQQREDIWTLDCSAQLELIDLITEHGKELERVRDELNQTDMQCRQACDQFKAGTWRDFSNIHEHSEEQRKEWKKNAECQLEQWKQIGESIRMQKITDQRDLFRLDPQAREEYKSIMEEREKICEEGQDVLRHCIQAEISYLRYGAFIDALRKREQELRDQSPVELYDGCRII